MSERNPRHEDNRALEDGLVTTMRREQYASGTAALQDTLTVAGADGVFDTALTNGLMAIAAAAIPSHPAAASTSKRLPAASGLLNDLATAFGKDAAGVVAVPTGQSAHDFDDRGMLRDLGYEQKVAVNVDLLQDALDRTQPARHARGATGLLTAADVSALQVLDEHPALRVLSEFRTNKYWERGDHADAVEYDRAIEFLEMLTEAEVEDRVEAVRATRGWPSDEEAIQDCPLCGNRSVVATGSDGWGYGIVAATCQVCSYRLSEHAAEKANLDAEWEARWAHL